MRLPITLLCLAVVAGAAAAPQAPAYAQTPAPEAIRLWPEGVPGAIKDGGPEVVADGRVSNVHDPALLPFPAPEGTRNGTAVIICPGGGYTRLAIEKEGMMTVRWLNSLGVSAFILKYRLKEYGHPAPLRDVLRAVRLLRSDAARFGIAPDRVGVLGYSAGGHLAATAGTLFDDPDGRTGASLDRVSARPDFVVLVYPVIRLTGPGSHAGSARALLGEAATPEMLERYSPDTRVTKDTPPTFLAHGGTDTAVPPENSALFYLALRRAGVPAEMHLYREGGHGIGLEPNHGPMSDWPARCAEWLAARGLLPARPDARQPASIPIWPEGVPGAIRDGGPETLTDGLVRNVQEPSLTPYLPPPGRANGTAVIVCPGGGYTVLAIDKEGADVARWLNTLGISAFVLKYRMKEYGHPAPLRDVLRAVRLLRSDGSTWGLRPDRIGVIGFSAGGHLAASAATLFDAPEGRTGATLDAVSARPDFAILVYPVIVLTGPYAHAGSRRALIGDSPAPGLAESLSLDTRVTKDTPPTFLVHGGTDTVVPPENSVRFYMALRRAGVAGELHDFERGAHGFGLQPGHGPVSGWPQRCAEWLAAQGLAALGLL